MAENALSLLRAINWLPDSSPLLTAPLLDWLLEVDSMTRRFERHCQQVTVNLLREGFVSAQDAAEDTALLPTEPRYWLREIELCGDGVPWLVARTLVPESTLNGPEQKLQQLGTIPLGRYLFATSTLTRDFIDVGHSAELWGRRSRLRLSGKPLLLTELFLPASPLYASVAAEGGQ
ncbi:chorismate pyruvate-lyase [Erwinia rhapontici]|uniref:Chorismate pyruvate-lyase n=1 Tax=Erwinia rhapontici TaxID=55212 RepID=A0ABN6DSX3_ERWRD|nr:MULTISPECIES: chorismate lyase [Erwinia]NKG31494.1 chorismate lyase [Erwinia rhapontici]NNS08305.1 chorismate lyase [Erwinia sp. JH02]TDS88995.1 chorismate lyase [Erwinia rhapontici]BCQ36965.1 chorismate pyruvate-lyase [Erwinia rhapontici]BCQ41976.1 chorismate pyruvate-lyase [Erwinia rhapontici]